MYKHFMHNSASILQIHDQRDFDNTERPDYDIKVIISKQFLLDIAKHYKDCRDFLMCFHLAHSSASAGGQYMSRYLGANCWKFLNGDVHQSTPAAAASSSACADLLLLPKIFSFLAFPSVNKEANMTKAAKKKKLFKSILNGFACFRKRLDL